MTPPTISPIFLGMLDGMGGVVIGTGAGGCGDGGIPEL